MSPTQPLRVAVFGVVAISGEPSLVSVPGTALYL